MIDAIITAVVVCLVAIYLGWIYGLLNNTRINVAEIARDFVTNLLGSGR